MSLVGSLADVAVVDLMQFIHLGGRTGTLFLERDDSGAHISFHRGRIVGAYGPASPSVCDLLLDAGALTQQALDAAVAHQATQAPGSTLGQALVATAAVTPDALRDAITRKVERTVFDLISWTRGEFRFEVDEVRGEQEIALIPGDVIAPLDINTEMVLIEGLRLFDERNQRSDDRAPEPRHESVALTRPTVAIQLVTADHVLAAGVTAALGERSVRIMPLRDAGIPAPGELPPLVLLDLRKTAGKTLARFRERHARALVVAIIGADHDQRDLYAAGIAAAVPPDPAVIASCCTTLLATRSTSERPEVELRSGIARLRRVIADLRGGIVSATLSLNLMTIVADSVDRAVLFLVQRDTMIALGAFGSQADGHPLVTASRAMTFTLGTTGPIAACIADGRARAVDYDDPELSAELRTVIDRPRSGHGVLFPVLGSRRVIAMIYADNGKHMRSVEDVEIVEIATAQVGLAFENELLRRQLDRHAIAR